MTRETWPLALLTVWCLIVTTAFIYALVMH